MSQKEKRTLIIFVVCSITILLLLSACQRTSSITPTMEVDSAPLDATISALQAENVRLKTLVAEAAMPVDTLPPTSTPKEATATIPQPSASATALPEVTIPESVVTMTQQNAEGYVFLVDPEIWTLNRPTGGQYEFLAHKEVIDCRIDVAPAGDPPEPLRYYTEYLGKRNWLVREYEDNAFFAQPDLVLALTGYEDETCDADQQVLLTRVLTTSEYNGGPQITPVPTATRRFPMDDFECAGALPPRLRAGDNAQIVAPFLWLRKEPVVEEATEIRLYPQFAPVVIEVIGGPVCEELFVYWQVQVSDLTEGGETFTGWMAESDGEEYLMDIWYLGW